MGFLNGSEWFFKIDWYYSYTNIEVTASYQKKKKNVVKIINEGGYTRD